MCDIDDDYLTSNYGNSSSSTKSASVVGKSSTKGPVTSEVDNNSLSWPTLVKTHKDINVTQREQGWKFSIVRLTLQFFFFCNSIHKINCSDPNRPHESEKKSRNKKL